METQPAQGSPTICLPGMNPLGPEGDSESALL